MLLNVPFALIGGIAGGVNFGISAGVGFITLFGIATQNGVILGNNYHKNLKAVMPLIDSIKERSKAILRSIVMTALMASLGLLPAGISSGIGSAGNHWPSL